MSAEDAAEPPAPEPAALEQPLLRVVRGEPDDAELVALTAVVLGLAAAGTGGAAPVAAPRSAWSNRTDLVRNALSHGPGAWRAAGFPR